MQVPTIIKIGAIGLVIRTNDHNPPHLHVIHAGREAKISISNAEVIYNRGFGARDMKKILKFIKSRKSQLLNEWRKYHA